MHGWLNLKEKIKGNIFFRALPFALLIAALTIIGLFGGFTLGKSWGGNIAGFALASVLSLLGFFIGFGLSYMILKQKYDQQ